MSEQNIGKGRGKYKSKQSRKYKLILPLLLFFASLGLIGSSLVAIIVEPEPIKNLPYVLIGLGMLLLSFSLFKGDIAALEIASAAAFITGFFLSFFFGEWTHIRILVLIVTISIILISIIILGRIIKRRR